MSLRRVKQGGRRVELLVCGKVDAGSDDRVDRVEHVGGEHGVSGPFEAVEDQVKSNSNSLL
jgi:hypothetical protein